MSAILEKLKSHPALVAAGVIAIIVLVYILNHSGGTTAVGVDTGTAVGAATDLQQAQLAAGAQAGQTAAALQANSDNIGGQIALATIAAQQSGAHDAIAGQVATSQINADQQVQSLLATLSAQVANHSADTALATTTVLATNQTQQQQILATSLEHAYDTSASVTISGQNAALAASESHDAHSGGLFGGGGFLGLGI